MLDVLPCGVIVLEKQNGKIIYGNQRARLLYGMAPRDLNLSEHPKLGLMKLDSTPYRAEEMPASRSLLHGEEVHGEELVLARPDGTQVTVSASSIPVYYHNGQIRAVIGVFDNITEQKRLE